ncbi:type IV pilus twitching motility protein PilT [Synoicihabitans lomoniglobus]|uniref:PilT/PilU family type 4a pilus ATPase n=1 Tax=Synoicihabitans lomoniglobus TaxID=2909285 RepID=A0AAE9ZYC6_9BACT|nr:PilT/PilU family type 4a pilus ATPase [Opitutaceae bacterium LMO-M01]WED64838.1 PilT/PilU family type 4a pilus ATPase [Opitutaceae bacterium LMO-M01]
MASIDRLLQLMLEKGGSDLHLNVGLPPKARISGNVVPLEDGLVTAIQMEDYLSGICPPARWEEFLEKKDLDLAHEIPGVARFRGNFLYNHWGQAGIFRQIPAEILSFSKLNLPEVLKKFCHMNEGLVVVTGPTGSGKSTTLAAMIDYINDNLAKHIITIEDPIEFVHPNKKSVIVHREVGEHTQSFGDALKGAMRHDPDILLVGEMRELETIKLALGCASMGMLVFGTLHTNNAPKTVDRIINAFPADEQNQVRVMLAGCLSGVVAQLLCKRQPKGRVAVHEILLRHEALPNTIRTGAISSIRAIIESGKNDGMTTMDWSLMDRVKDKTITPLEAFMKATDKATFQPLLKPGDLDAAH